MSSTSVLLFLGIVVAVFLADAAGTCCCAVVVQLYSSNAAQEYVAAMVDDAVDVGKSNSLLLQGTMYFSRNI